MNHPLQCRCGTLKGLVSHPEKANRGVCYCKDCQAFAHFLDRAADTLDEMGGTDVIATLPQYVTFTQGVQALACMSLSPKGLLRWYARCCNTPVGNTPRNYKFSYVGLVHSCLENASISLESSFGPVRMRLNTQSARHGKPKPMPLNMLAVLPPFALSLLRARLSGGYRRTSFFDEGGTPVVPPKVLSRSERDAFKNK